MSLDILGVTLRLRRPQSVSEAMSLRIGNALGAHRIIKQVNDSASDSEPCEIQENSLKPYLNLLVHFFCPSSKGNQKEKVNLKKEKPWFF